MRMLVTRPADRDDPYMALVRELGGEPVSYPLYKIEPLKTDVDLAGIMALVFTSAHGAVSFAAQSSQRDLPVYAVGPQTADAARTAGFADTAYANGTAADLVRLIPDGIGPVLYGRGAEISYPVADTLAARGISVKEVILYKTVPIEPLPPVPPADIVLFFSARTAQAFADMIVKQRVSDNLRQTKALCIGAGMVEFLRDLPWASVRVAEQPDRAGMTALIDDEMIGHKV